MDKQQFAKLAVAIKAAYPSSKVLEDNASMDFWFMMLMDIDYKIAENAVMEHICTSVFAPNIAEIRKLCMERCLTPIANYDDAWGTVQKAIGRYGWTNPDAAFATMDPLTLSVVKNLGWSHLCQSENMESDRANFRDAYKAKAETELKRQQLPQFVEKNKLLLQKQYIPAIEAKQVPQIKTDKAEEHKEITQEQQDFPQHLFEETKRRILGNT